MAAAVTMSPSQTHPNIMTETNVNQKGTKTQASKWLGGLHRAAEVEGWGQN